MKKWEAAYADTVFSLVSGGFFLGTFLGVLFALVALVDLILKLNWGYSWGAVLGGILIATISYGGAIFVKWIRETYFQIRR